MWKAAGLFMGAVSALAAQTIREFPLDAYKVVELPVSREVTTLTLPGSITAVAGADMLIDDGRAATEVEEGAAIRFHITHAKGTNFLLVRSVQPEASATLTLIFEGAAYVVQLQSVAANPVASAIFTRNSREAAVKLARAPEPVRFSPRVGLSVLDRARAYPVLARSLPKAVEGVTLRAQHRKIDLPDLEIDVQEVYRFSREDAVAFLLNVRNKTDQVIEITPSTFAARVGDEKFEQSIANGPRVLQPGESREAEFAIVGMPDGTRNDLSAENAFTILVNTSRRPPPTATAATPPTKEEPSS
jgi:hypothetical protein